jgi:signal transduction histidine kinase
MKNEPEHTDRLGALRIVAVYAVFSSLWIYLSDSALGRLARDPETITRLSKFKGIGFIVLSSLLLYRLISRHVQEAREAEKALKEAKEAAEAANRAKSQFLANMSHELRTPMGGVLGMLEVVLGGQLEGQQRDYIRTAHNSAGSLVRILNDILEITKIEAGRITLEDKPFVLRECVTVAVDIFASEARRKGLDFIVTMDEGLPDIVSGDSLRLQSILTNLVANAIKFTERGKIEVDVSAGSRISNGKLDVTFSVRDTGIGIPNEMKPRIFRPFSQVDDSDTRRYGGTGLGLAISRHIVELMGGTIYFESEEGQGCRFVFTVPLNVTAATSAFNALDTGPKEKDDADSGG